MEPRVVVEMGPSKASKASKELVGQKRQQRWRALRYTGIAAAVTLCVLQLFAQAALVGDADGEGQARSLVRAASASWTSDATGAPIVDVSTTAPPPPPPGSTADLDALYPAEHAFWAGSASSGGGRPPWIERMRGEWLADAVSNSPSNAPSLVTDATMAASASREREEKEGLRVESLPAVPRKLHQTWKDADPPRSLFSPRWSESIRSSNPDWEYRLWTDDENRNLISTHYRWFLSTYDSYASAIQRADAARYFIAYHHGGLYADLDMECFRPLAPLIEDASLVLSYKHGANFSLGASNAIFLSSRAHPFWKAVFAVLRSRSHAVLRDHRAVLYSTGPAVLREALRRILRLPASRTISPHMLEILRDRLGIVVLDSKYLYPVTAEHRTEDELTSLPPEAHCTHHFVSSWVAHNQTLHNETRRLRREGHTRAAMQGPGQQVMETNEW
jgi:hypothetical protein